MIESTSACIRGCSLYRRHLTDCEDGDACSGCLPRRAEYGLLCWPCHRRYELMLHDAPTVYRWLTGNMATGQGAATEGDHVTASKELPLPIKAAVYDIRELMADQFAATVDHLVELLGVTGPGRHSVERDVRFMQTWLGSVERQDFIADWWEELADTMVQAHALAPWRPAMRRVAGVPCPRCEESNLAIFGGESDITCLSCRAMMTEDQFELWQNVLQIADTSAS